VTEHCLSGLHVDALGDEARRVGPAQVVEAQALIPVPARLRVLNHPAHASSHRRRVPTSGLWVGPAGGEGAKFWMSLLTELRNRGVRDTSRAVCGSCGIDYERVKADARHAADRVEVTASDDDAIRTFELDAAARGVDYVTFRRIAADTDLSPEAARNLRRHLVTTRPDRYVWPLWSVAAPTAVSARA
jgi:hypothetical protein